MCLVKRFFSFLIGRIGVDENYAVKKINKRIRLNNIGEGHVVAIAKIFKTHKVKRSNGVSSVLERVMVGRYVITVVKEGRVSSGRVRRGRRRKKKQHRVIVVAVVSYCSKCSYWSSAHDVIARGCSCNRESIAFCSAHLRNNNIICMCIRRGVNELWMHCTRMAAAIALAPFSS